jgi:nucleoid DNA-binding protein
VSLSEPQHKIWEDVKSLLHQHDCVIVPGFGGFVCNREPARIDQVSHVITPPSRKVVFNQNLKNNDGLLAGYLVQHRGIGYTQAIQLIEEVVQHTLTLLQEKKQLAIDLFGNFRLNADANYVFLPDKRNNYLTSSYGLGLIQADPVASRSIKVVKARTFKDRKKDAKTMKPQRNIWPAALIGVLALLLTVNGYIFLSDHSINELHIGENNTMSISSWFDSLFHSTKADAPAPLPIAQPFTEDSAFIPAAPAVVEETTVSPIDTTTTVVEAQPTNDQPVESSIDIYAPLYAFAAHFETSRGTIYFPQQATEAVSEAPVIVTESVNTEPATARPAENATAPTDVLSTKGVASGFYVIGGVFCKERNAKKYLAQLNNSGYENSELLMNEKIKCKRVSYRKFAKRKDAEQFCREIKSTTNPSAWVLAVN